MKPINAFIIWLLLLCLPMQAMAALAMMSSTTMSAAHSYSSPADDHCPPQADDGACACSAMCALAAALAPAGLNPAFYRPAASGPIPYLGAYAGRFFPDGLERPPPHAPS